MIDTLQCPIMQIPSKHLRSGTITFTDVSEAQRLWRIRGNMNQNDHRNMEHFEELGTPPKEEERKSHYNNDKEASMIGSCQSHGHFEILGFLISEVVVVVMLIIFLVVNFIL